MLRRIGSVGGQLLQFKLFGYVACSGVHRRFGLELRNIAVLVEGWVQATSDVDRVLDARRIRLVRAVRHHVRDDRGSEGLRMDVRGQVLERLVETGAFAPLVTRSEDVLRYRKALIIVYDSLAVEGVTVGKKSDCVVSCAALDYALSCGWYTYCPTCTFFMMSSVSWKSAWPMKVSPRSVPAWARMPEHMS